MTDLEDVFGDEFAQHVQERTAKRREERNRLTEEQMAEVASLAINEGKFEDGDPRFTYTTDNGITHNVMLVQVPDPDNGEVWEHLSEPWDGAAKLPLDYLGEWYWSVFPDKKDVQKLEQGMYAIVTGGIEESEGEGGEVYYSIYPVRGILTLDEAKEYAQMGDISEEFGGDEEDTEEDVFDDSDDEQEEEETTTEDESSDDDMFSSDDDSSSSGGGGLDGLVGDDDDDTDESGSDDEDEPAVPYEEIANTVEALADDQDPDEEPRVYEIEEDSPNHRKLTTVVCNRLDIDNEEAAAEVVIDVIQEHRDDEEEEEEDETNKLF